MRASRVQTRDLIGTPDELRNVLERAHADGRLISFTEPRHVIHVQAELLPLLPGYSVRGDRSRFNPLANPHPYLVGTALALGGAVTGLVVYEVVQLVHATIRAAHTAGQWADTHGGTLAGIAVLIVLVLISGGGAAAKCAGLHCGGCRG